MSANYCEVTHFQRFRLTIKLCPWLIFLDPLQILLNWNVTYVRIDIIITDPLSGVRSHFRRYRVGTVYQHLGRANNLIGQGFYYS